MLGSTGNRCGIYEKIDALDEARSVADLVRRLKPILSELAYYAVTGEASVMEAREEWHSQYADALYYESASEYNAAAGRAAVPAGRTGAPAGRTGAPAGALAPSPTRRRHDRDEQRRPPPPSNRPRPGDIPSSLQAIMNGSHHSLKEDDR